MKKFLPVLLALTLSSCAMVNSLTTDHSAERQERYQEEAAKRVVYTPLVKSRPATDAEDVEVLLRPPERKYKELGIISMYRQYSDETAASLLVFVKARAAAEGGDAILLTEAAEHAVGTITSSGATAIGNSVVGSSVSTLMTEGTIHGIVIAYEDKAKDSHKDPLASDLDDDTTVKPLASKSDLK